MSELNQILQSGFYESPRGYDDVDCFLQAVINLENKINFYFKNTKKDFIMSENDGQNSKNSNNIRRLCEKKILTLIKLDIIVT